MTRRLLVSLWLASLFVAVRSFGVCYDSYDPGNAGTHFQTIKSRFSFVRTYDTHFWNGANAIKLAAANGLTIHAGVWLRAGDQQIAADVNAIIAGLRSHPSSVPIVYVGNEDLMNGWNLDMVRAKVESVRASLVNAGVSKNVLIGSVQTDGDWLGNRGLAAAVDVIGVNIYPFFGASEDSKTNPIADLETRWNAMLTAFPGKRIELVETGWPHAGPTLNGHVPSYTNAVDYFNKVQAWIQNQGKGGQRPSYFMFHDNPHKVIGSIEGSFGLANQRGEWKFSFAGDNSGPAPASPAPALTPTPAPTPTPALPTSTGNLRASFQLVTAKGLVVATVNNALSAVANTNQAGSFWTFNAATQQVRSNNADNRCLDAFQSNGQFHVHLYDCGDGSNGNQKWRVIDNKVIHATHSNLCLDVNPTDPSVQVFGCVANNDNQRFIVTATTQRARLTNGVLALAALRSGQVTFINSNASEAFWMVDATTGLVKNEAVGQCLDAYQARNGGAVHLYACEATNVNQKWAYDATTKQLRHAKHNGYCLDMATDSGSYPHLWSCHSAASPWLRLQQFVYGV
ncbi:hypothetical protein SPRG_12808 [Saprolegnia parasitica CBS 223.65]|uniref:glucan endo-1,3-beta-D-glucosidase n=1 Tax=Saprolegnia parasitica (strain CBS 223.65) TaxID=695850 RepID=A0A067C6B4_SAPPC|nr:hypothetical protein SPRG_12808 [Saprolegnia parasitica CBS 223.65]KDO22347.1 hypothetical protein SPRG_12808 [Saprolegnia parasitica CBS 223.65]|eukprot:XP_012206981.1 hypothetical protein SPRG_12808 [Saprolegnia parasitica CBS 223.65]